jgi:hypothetical protein
MTRGEGDSEQLISNGQVFVDGKWQSMKKLVQLESGDWATPEKAQELMQHLEKRKKAEKDHPTPARRSRKGKSHDDAKDSETEKQEANFLASDLCLYEEILRPDGPAFMGYDLTTGEYRTVGEVLHDGRTIVPLKGEEIDMGAIKLSSGVAEYGNTLALLKELEAYIYRYLDVSNDFRKFASYYVLLSWLYDRFSTLPYLRFLGDTGVGKSRGLDVVGGVCYRATIVSGCITPAPIYRLIRRWGGTIVLDEADLRDSDEYNEVVTILNCGFEKGRPVIRATKDNPDKLQYLPTYGPKVFATRRRFKDAALEARCLTEIMQETTRDDIPATLTTTFYKHQEDLRNRLLLFRLKNFNRVNPEDATVLDLPGIEPRLRQISTCFASLFGGQPDILADYQTFIQNHQRELIEQRSSTPIGQVMGALFSIIESHTAVTAVTPVTDDALLQVSPSEIAERVNMNPQTVGQILKTLGLRTKPARVAGSLKRCIILDPVKLKTLRKRYVPQEDDVTTVTTVTTPGGFRQLETVEHGGERL